MKPRTKLILDVLKEEYPDAKCELDHGTPFQLLVATILSAQATDKKVNEVTAVLFKECPDVDSFLKLSLNELEFKIKQIGLYRSKAKNILIMCNQLKQNFNSEVPKTMEELTSLAGAGRKTA
ncbi:MAG: endonuclease III domain-containing protein, partial [Clostridium sp.]